MRIELKTALDAHKEILFTDECMFTSKTAQSKAFSARSQNIEVTIRSPSSKPWCLLASVSAERGLVHWKLYERSVNAQKFNDYLSELG